MKKNIILVLVTAIICISGTAYASGLIGANQISYTRNNTETTLQDALDYVYSNLKTKMAINSFGTALYSSSQGDRIGLRSTTKEVVKGKYIVAAIKGSSWNTSDTSWPNYQTETFNLGADYQNLSCSNNCVIRKLGEYWNRVRPTNKNGDFYNHYSIITELYFVEITSNTDTLETHITEVASSYGGTSATLVIVPIN